MRTRIGRILVFNTRRVMPGRFGKMVRRVGRKILFRKR